ncbi:MULTISPECIES: hypothetical protein [Bacillaceae]|uniref:hypothetical protein n=1 Tax=Bacillaceae TaxID=186817 RepID=UPI00065FFD03|nr:MULTISPECIES: hypothetical protein [Bacillaceae]MCF7620923.1 hypothetical protein [Peribacillus frigoritolerans]PRA87626.1 hypothetical protein CQ056_14225 [Peribacillus simplex]
MKNFPNKRDFFYIVGFLVIAIIFIISGRLSDNTNVVDYVGFAGTIVSILLAVIAIIYSFYQSSTYENSTQKLDITASKIEQITNELSEVAHISGNIKSLKETVDTINNIVKNIEENLYDDINKKPEETTFNKHNLSNEDKNIEGFHHNKQFFESVANNLTVLASIVVVWIQKSHKLEVNFNIKECTSYFLESVMLEKEKNNTRYIGMENAINGLLIAYEHLDFFELDKVIDGEFEVLRFNEIFSEVIDEEKTDMSLLELHFMDIEEILARRKK